MLPISACPPCWCPQNFPPTTHSTSSEEAERELLRHGSHHGAGICCLNTFLTDILSHLSKSVGEEGMLIYLTFIPECREVGGESCQPWIAALRGLTWLKIRFWRWIEGGGAGREKFSLGIVWLAWLLPWSHCFWLSDWTKTTQMICWEWESEAFSQIFQMLPLFSRIFLNTGNLTQTTNRNLSLPCFSLSPCSVIYA